MAGVDEVVEDARIITQDEDRGAAGRGETNRPHDAEARERIMKLVESGWEEGEIIFHKAPGLLAGKPPAGAYKSLVIVGAALGPMCEKRSGATRSLDERMSELEKCLQELQHEVPGGIRLDWMEVQFKERMELLSQTAQAVVAKKLDLQRHAAMQARRHQHGSGGPGHLGGGRLPTDAGGGTAPGAPGSAPAPAPTAAEIQQQQQLLAALPVAYPVADAADIAHGAPGGSGRGTRTAPLAPPPAPPQPPLAPAAVSAGHWPTS